MHRTGLVLLALTALPSLCFAVETKNWIQNEQSDFEKGTLTKLSLRSDGRLLLAPVFREVLDSSVPYLWALAEDSKGNVYAGGGGPSTSMAKLFVIDAAGKVKVLDEVPGMEIHAIAVNRNDRVFVSTSPDGKVYRINAAGKAEQFYDPKAKYIWAIAFDSKGNLFLATGDQGEIQKVTPDGKGSVFFKTEETHARSLAIDRNDNLIVGTEPGGLVLRVSPNGDGFVLYQAGKREVTSVAVAQDGAIYAAAVGNKASGGPVQPPSISVLPIPPTPLPGGGQRTAPQGSASPNAAASAGSPPSLPGGSEVYRIEKDGYPRKIWSHPHDVVYTIGFDAQNRPILGTGNKGKIYRIDSDVLSTTLINAEPTQITALLSGSRGRLYAATGNIGKVFQIGPQIEKQGHFESDPFDGAFFSDWGRLSYKGEARGGGLSFESRSGNLDRPQKNWSAWAPVDENKGGRVSSPAARFIQYRATLSAGSDGTSPELTEVDVAYMQKNVPPVLEEIEITPPNYKFPSPSANLTATPSLTLPPLGQKKRQGSISLDGLAGMSQALPYAKGYIGARWSATDPNNDELLYRVEIRGAKETGWKLLRDKVKEKYLSWDSTAYPDGEYVLRVVASDAPANPPGQALTATLESDPFVIDNTPPAIAGLTATRAANVLTVHWKAHDAQSVIVKSEYSLDGKEWVVVEPTTRLSDSLEHDYVLTLPNIAAGEHTIAVRVTDDFDNQAVDKTVLR